MSDHLRRRQAQWGTQTLAGFLPPARAVDAAAAALAPAELLPFLRPQSASDPPSRLYQQTMKLLVLPFGKNNASALIASGPWHVSEIRKNNNYTCLHKLQHRRYYSSIYIHIGHPCIFHICPIYVGLWLFFAVALR